MAFSYGVNSNLAADKFCHWKWDLIRLARLFNGPSKYFVPSPQPTGLAQEVQEKYETELA